MQINNFYKRQTVIKEVGESGQEKLNNINLLIVGAGGLGHPASVYLTAAGIGNITIIDDDLIEETNLNRQILFTSEELGLPKAKVLSSRLKRQNPLIEIHTIETRITNKNIEEIAKNFDCILDCTDNFITKFLLHDFCWFNKKLLIQASIYQFEGQIQVFDFQSNSDKGCLRCLWPQVPTSNSSGNCQEAGVIGAVAGTLGTLQAMEVIKYVLNLGHKSHLETKVVDLLNTQVKKIKWNISDECPLCSSKATIKSIGETDNLILEYFETRTLDENATIIDIREPTEFQTTKFNHFPLSDIKNWKQEINKNNKYIFICSYGVRSKNLVQSLIKENYNNCYSLYNGFNAL